MVVEKPFTNNSKHAEELIELKNKTGKLLFPFQSEHLRLEPVLPTDPDPADAIQTDDMIQTSSHSRSLSPTAPSARWSTCRCTTTSISHPGLRTA